MGWSSAWPPKATAPFSDLQDYDVLKQLYHALRLRARVALRSCSNWPQGHWEWGTGIIGTVTTDGTTITVTDNSSPPAMLIDGDDIKRWVGFNAIGGFNGGGVNENAPANYTLIVDSDNDDASLVLKGAILDTTSDTFELADDGSWTINRTLSSLNGKAYSIIKQGGVSWADRWPPRPNSIERQTGATTSATTTSLTDSTKGWTVDQWVGKDLMVTAGGKQKRLSITSNTANTLVFSVIATAPGGNYWIVDNDGFFRFERAGLGWRPFTWYAGEKRAYWSHYPDDQMAGSDAQAVTTKPIFRGTTPESCNTVPATDVYDIDAYIDIDDVCGAADTIVALDYWKCIRAVQAGTEAAGQYFIMDYEVIDENHRSGIVPGVLPILMRQIGGNYQERFFNSTDASVATIDSITLPDGATSQGCYWVVLDRRGLFARSGVGTATSTTVSGDFTNDDVINERKLGISFGWTRAEPRRVSRVYRRVIFKPDMEYNLDGEPIGLVDPPTALYPGEYIAYEPSTNYAVYGELGMLTDGGRTFVLNQLARFVGSNFGDPTTGDLHGDAGIDPNPETEYYDAAYMGRENPTEERPSKQWLEPDSSGTVLSGTAVSLTIGGSESLWLGTTPRITHNGISTGGDTTHLIDSTKAADGFWLSMGGTRWINQIIEVEIADVWEKSVVTAQAMGASPTLTLSPALSATASIKDYKFREDPGVNGGGGKGTRSFWQGTTLRVTTAANVDHDFIVKQHDDKTFFFTAAGGYTPVLGDTWRIVWFKPGDVLRRSSGALWVTPRTDVLLTAIQPTIATNYGRHRKGDYWRDRDGGSIYLTQMYDALNAMYMTFEEAGWSNQGENNIKTAEGNTNTSDTMPWSTIRTETQGLYAAASATPDGGVPYVMATLGIAGGLFKYGNLSQRYSYLTISPFKCARFGMTSRNVQVWIYTTFDEFDNNIGTIVFSYPGGEYYYVREFSTGPLTAGGVSLQHRKWTRAISQTSSADSITLLVGNTSLPQPTWPVDPTQVDLAADVNGKSILTQRGAYVFHRFSVADWTSLFDGFVKPPPSPP